MTATATATAAAAAEAAGAGGAPPAMAEPRPAAAAATAPSPALAAAAGAAAEGPAAAAAAATLPPTVSRYRSLRGKSVSSPRAFDIFRDCTSDDESSQSSGSPRRRSQTVTPHSHAPPQAARQLAGTVPPLPTFSILGPKPVNANVNTVRHKPSLKALATVKETLLNLKAAGKRSTIAAAADATNTPNTTTTTTTPPQHAALAPQQDRQRPPPLPSLRQQAEGRQEGEAQEQGQPGAQEEEQRLVVEPPSHVATHAAARLAERLEAETDRILAEQKKLDLARLQAQLPVTPPPKPSPSSKRLLLDKLAFLSRGRRCSAKNSSSQPGSPSTIAQSIFSPALSISRHSSVDDSPPGMSFIEPGGKGIVPQIDAPTSAINGGERHVIVRCLSSTITLPVTAETSAVDIVRTTAEMTQHRISPTSVVLECYFVLGLERRLRRYERIRDVLNSWDTDQQNSLLILSDDTASDDQDLDLSSVPRTDDQPPGFCVQLHHSSRPGKWNKRWVILLDNGQMFASKRPDAGPSDKDSTVVCHLSDFDIYAPKESEMRRNLKPPKKFCYAIKSQQKTFVFPNGENFVHFFCTDDDKLAARFYELVHGWRSWYLANRMVDLARRDKAPQITYNILLGGAGASKRGARGDDESPSVSMDEASYMSEEPLMDVSGFKAPDMSLINVTPTKRLSKESSASKGLKAQDLTLLIPETPKGREFSAHGLLGDAYDKRRHEDAQTQAQDAKVEGPFIDGPSLLNGGVTASPESADKPEPQSWFPSAAEHTARIRSKSSTHNTRRPMTADATPQSRREKQPAPLLSFNKDFPEPPRFRDIQSLAGRHAGSQPLINFATGGPSQPQNAPPARVVGRRGLPASSPGPGPGSPLPPLPPGARGRGRSTPASAPASSSRRFNSEQQPPVPPLPSRSVRRDKKGEPATRSGSSPRHTEPLVNRAR